MEEMELTEQEMQGKITSGLGEAKIWVSKIKKVFEKKTGMNLFEGTLNIDVEKNFSIGETNLIINPNEYEGTQKLLIKECEIFGNKAYILRTLDNENGKGTQSVNIIEVVSNINFRKQYNLKNGDLINIIIK